MSQVLLDISNLIDEENDSWFDRVLKPSKSVIILNPSYIPKEILFQLANDAMKQSLINNMIEFVVRVKHKMNKPPKTLGAWLDYFLWKHEIKIEGKWASDFDIVEHSEWISSVNIRLYLTDKSDLEKIENYLTKVKLEGKIE